MGAVPLGRALEPVLQTDLGVVAQIATGLVDPERAHLAEPVNPAREDGRIDAEGFAELLAHVPGDDQGPDGQRGDRHVDAHGLAHLGYQGANGDVLAIGDQVRLARALALLHGEHEGIHEVVDVHRVVVRLAASEHDEPTASGALVNHHEALGVAGAVDRGGTEDRVLHAAIAVLVDDLFALILRELVVVGGRDRRRLVARRVFDVPVHALGGAVDELARAGGDRGLGHHPGPLDVDVVVQGVGGARLPERGGEMLDDLSALASASHASGSVTLPSSMSAPMAFSSS